MHLLRYKANGDYRLTWFSDSDIPPYIILSHTWNADDEEYTFEDIIAGTGKDKPGYAKVSFCAQQAFRDRIKYFWVDTCCIDKSNESQLNEAVNSMYDWYRNAQTCYVYLSDVSKNGSDNGNNLLSSSWKSEFRNSRWFTRGWTLQELIAPGDVEFYSSEYEHLGSRRTMKAQIHEITGIPLRAFLLDPLSDIDDAEKWKWTRRRQTTRKEDEAYCLLGIFGVHIPLNYGEEGNALSRLRKAIEDKAAKQRLNDEDTQVENVI
jgi:hypothetical protein